MMTCADDMLTFFGRGPPPVPSRISLVLAPCASLQRGSHAAAASTAAALRNVRRSLSACTSASSRPRVLIVLQPVCGHPLALVLIPSSRSLKRCVIRRAARGASLLNARLELALSDALHTHQAAFGSCADIACCACAPRH